MRFKPPHLPLMVYTDLDGTLLDHDSYRFDAALPALKRLIELAVPVIPVTSKTLAELAVLGPQLGLNGPCIAENGGLIAIPRGYFEAQPPLQTHGDSMVELLSPAYADIVGALDALRRRSGFDFAGFADLSDADVARLTGLGMREAARARQRLCSEPVIWRDSDDAFETFVTELNQRGLTLVKGGRFHHVLGSDTDKARAIDRLNQYFVRAGFADFTRIALGDSPNDALMLQSADIAVVVRRKDGTCLEVETDGARVETRASGPRGWNEFFQHYLDTGATDAAGQRTTHG